jgi:hypothetical protein
MATYRTVKDLLETVAFIFAIGYAVVTFFQWQDARRNFKTDERAWVLPLVPSAEKTDSGDTYFKIPFKNTGHTPALRVHAWIGTTPNFAAIPNTDPIATGNDVDSSVVAPDGIGNTSTMQTPFKDISLDPIRHGARLYIYGTIAYNDVFGIAHWSQFCVYPGMNLQSFGPCSKHNTTDDAPSN